MKSADRRTNIAARNDLKGHGKSVRKGISKALAYIARIFCIEYDIKHAIDAYGADFLHMLIDEIKAGRVNCKQDVERWSAFKALNSHVSFETVKHEYFQEPIADNDTVANLPDVA